MPGDYAQAMMYEHLLALSREAFSSGLYITAYYALAAAMHCATTAAQLAETEAIAQEEANWVDTHKPGHHLSSKSLAERGIANPWVALEDRARTRRWLLERGPTNEPLDESLGSLP